MTDTPKNPPVDQEWEEVKPEPIYADPVVLNRVREAMANCEDNGYWNETIALSAESLTDDLIEKDADIAEFDRDIVLTAVRTFKTQHSNNRISEDAEHAKKEAG